MLNCASTWANQRSGSAGQKGGSLRLTAATETVGLTAAGPLSEFVALTDMSVG